ncbi:hypothetical protein QYE76_069208 [Lolium multiflorum]|uniref:RNase H type-1 domain-containing protein n=1 Tax=Lolium multiflorum TaxID=4521 RepID=A0AAD8SHK9_LOLMU|nr:hypothetical protein QYE76_069208 [Lolium multiflorum]
MKPPTTKKELQCLISKINFVRRFISNLSGRIESFMGLVKIRSDEEFRWGAEQQRSFDDIKEYLTKPPVLVPPQQDRSFYIYLSVADTSIASVVVQVYDAEIIVICKSDVIKHMLSAPVLKGRLGKWMFALSEFDIRYQPAKAVKGQALADLIAERINTDVAALSVRAWAMFFDGSVCEDGCGIGVLLVSPRGATYSFSIRLSTPCTNNVAEYEAICKGMELLLDAGAEAVEIFGDSKLVISQLTEEYKCESESLFPLWIQCRELMAQFRLKRPTRVIKLIKRKIDEHPRRWHEVLSEVVGLSHVVSWSNKNLAIPSGLWTRSCVTLEIKAGSRRIIFQNDLTTEEYAALMSDSIEDATELRLWSLEKIKENKAKVARTYNKKVKPKEFQVGDLVWEAVLPLGTKDKMYDHGAPSINFNQFLEKEKLKGNGSNFTDWSRHVRIFLTGVSMQYVLEAPLGPPPPPAVSEDIKNVYETRVTRYSEIQCAILCSLEAELQKRFEHHDPCEMMRELKLIFETHAAVESYEASKQFFNCMMEEGSSVSEHMFAMSGHAKKLSDLGIVIPNKLGIHRVLQSLPPSYKNFVMNYNMQNMNKELPELFSMLKSAEVEIKKENQVLMVNKTTSFKKQGKPNKGNFKKGGKKVAAPPEKPKAGPKPETVCYYCQGKGLWAAAPNTWPMPRQEERYI